MSTPLRTNARAESMLLNMGPSHPAMHGAVRIMLELDGERILNSEVEVGYLHRGFEKTCENRTYFNLLPYTDRLNYVSPLINNIGYVLTVEKLLDLEPPERAQLIRVLMSELSRAADHLTCLAAMAMECGAFTVFLYKMKAREFLWDVIEQTTGARMTTSYIRVGGVRADLHPGFDTALKKAIEEMGSHARIWVTDAKEVENYIPGEAIRKVFENEKLPDIGQYERFYKADGEAGEDYWHKHSSKRTFDKVELAMDVVPHLDKVSLDGRFDLASQMAQICDLIGKWNK